MTSKQIEKRKDEIYFRVYKGGARIGKWNEFTDEEKRELEELSCREMIISCMIYTTSNFYDKNTDTFSGKYAVEYIKSLGEETVRQLWNEQKETMAKAKIHYGAYIDSEGGVYASVTWGE